MVNGMLTGMGLLIQGGASIVVVLSGVAWLVGTGCLISNLTKQRSEYWIREGESWKPVKQQVIDRTPTTNNRMEGE